ncbi:MAG: MATE family efflux transporter [Clostridia bacterium]|nr:MATE family efflux transporter [Clostridia bacterium]
MKDKLSNRATFKTIVLLAWPTVMEQILETAVQYADAAMVGRIGARATAAVGVTTTVSWLINSTLHALGIGFLAYIARAIGAKEPEKARRAVAQTAMIAIIMGTLLTALTLIFGRSVPVWMHADADVVPEAARYFMILYAPMLFRAAQVLFSTCLRAAGDTKTPLRVNLILNAINVVLNFLLIYPTRTVSLFGARITLWGANLGVTGAAIASAAALIYGGTAMTIAVYRHRDLSPRGLSLKPDRTILKPCLKIALPCALQRFGTSFGYVAFASMINTLGTIATAAHSIANTAESAFYIPGYGMQTAAATLAGNCYGARDAQAMRRISRMMIYIEVALMTLTGSILFFTAPALMGLFTPDAAVIDLGARVLRMVAVTEPIYGIAIIIEGIFQGVGDTGYAFAFNIIGMWGVRILGTYIMLMVLGKGLTAAWACMIAHNILLGALLSIRYLRGRWNPLNEREG